MMLHVALLGEGVIGNQHRLMQHLPESVQLHPISGSPSEAGQVQLLSGCDAVIAVEFKLPAQALTRLRLLQVAAAGYEKVNFNCLSRRVSVCNATGHGPAVAEYVMAALLSTRVGLAETDASFRSGSWDRRGSTHRPLRSELASQKVGVLGYGHIGQSVVRACAALGVPTMVCTRSRPADDEIGVFASLNSWRDFFQEVDYVVVCLAETPDTVGFIDAEKLRCMKPTSIIVNVSRGAVIDEVALFDALSNGEIAGAVLDTWWRYPSVDAPNATPSRMRFETLTNVVMTPHVSAWTEQAIDRRWRAIAENLVSLKNGKALRDVVRQASMVYDV